MFDKKQATLLTPRKKAGVVSTAGNAFVNAGLGKKSRKAPDTVSGNAALKYTSTGLPFVDEFGTAGRFRTPRDYKDVDVSMRKLWVEDKLTCLKFALYLRMVTRVVQFPDGTETEETQRGQGLKHEGIFRMMWVAVNYPKTFWKNIYLIISVGGWKDIITMLSYDLQYNGWSGRKLDWTKMGHLILAGLENPKTTNLVKKYLPQIKPNSQCRTVEAQADNIIAKWIVGLLYDGYKNPDPSKPESDMDLEKARYYRKYRKLKTSGTAHEWQKVISSGNLAKLNFDSIHGRALTLLVSGKFLKNNKLEDKYSKWIASKPTAKFTGYVYELTEQIKGGIKPYQVDTINAQFNQLVTVAAANLAGQGLRPISVVDTSGSMASPMYLGGGKVGKLRSIQVAFSSALFFDEMLPKTSPFKDIFLTFSGATQMQQFKGEGFVERFSYVMSRNFAGGGTNFESVFDYFANFKKANPHINESEIPNFIICWSDGEFNRVTTGLKTNVERGREILRKAGYSKDFYENFGIGFIDLPNTFYGSKPAPKFETFGDVKNVFYFSGHDLSPLAFLFGANKSKGLPSTAQELFEAAMDQEVLNMLEL